MKTLQKTCRMCGEDLNAENTFDNYLTSYMSGGKITRYKIKQSICKKCKPKETVFFHNKKRYMNALGIKKQSEDERISLLIKYANDDKQQCPECGNYFPKYEFVKGQSEGKQFFVDEICNCCRPCVPDGFGKTKIEKIAI